MAHVKERCVWYHPKWRYIRIFRNSKYMNIGYIISYPIHFFIWLWCYKYEWTKLPICENIFHNPFYDTNHSWLSNCLINPFTAKSYLSISRIVDICMFLWCEWKLERKRTKTIESKNNRCKLCNLFLYTNIAFGFLSFQWNVHKYSAFLNALS